ncbi:MAG TPA: hypothetical protein ENN99_02080 [Chloroflexi bacterium]|nr:hypothetical protein [Chloroflexota bacterium]
MRSLNQCLLDTNTVRLRVISQFWDVELATHRRREMAAQMAQAMAHPDRIASVWDALPDDQRQALDALLSHGGRMPLRIFAREWGVIRPMGPGKLEREKPWRDPVSPAEGLWYKGLVFRAFDQDAEETYEILFVPPELERHLPTDRPPHPPVSLQPIPPPPTAVWHGDALLDDACTLLSYLQNMSVHPDSRSQWPRHHETRLLHRLRDPDVARLSLLRHLVQDLEWLRLTDAGHLRPDPGPVTEWLQSPVQRQRSDLVTAWRDSRTWNDLFHVPTLRPEETGAWYNDPLRARQAVLDHLAACSPGAWYALNDLVTTIKQTTPDFQRPDGDYTTWYIRDATTGTYLSGFESWPLVEGALIRYLITSPLTWLGWVELGASAPGETLMDIPFRLSPIAAASLGLAADPPAHDPAPLTLQRDFTVNAPPARRYERFQLARVADWVASPTITTGSGPFVYRITPASLDRARRQGIPVERVLQFLRQVTDAAAPIPRAIETALTRWDARGSEVRLERVVLLRLASPELLTQVLASPRARPFIGEQIGPTTVQVHSRDWPRLVTALGEIGVLPDVISLDEERE